MFIANKRLHGAAERGNLKSVHDLLRLGADVNSRNKQQWTPLHLASAMGNTDVVMELLRHGAIINRQTAAGDSALHWASFYGHQDVTTALLNQGADINAKNTYGWVPLHAASRNGHKQVVMELLSRGADINAEDYNRETPLDVARTAGENDIVRILEESITMQSTASRLISAAQRGDLKAVDMLLKGGADINAKNPNGWTPLHFASCLESTDVAMHLLSRGATVSSKSIDGWTPLHSASESGQKEISILLLNRGADINAVSNNGWTPLHSASESGHKHVVMELLDRGANIKAADVNCATPLDVARAAGQMEIARILQEVLTMRSSASQLIIAAQSGDLQTAKILLSHGADANAKDINGWTPLHFASCFGSTNVALELLSCGADVNTKNNDGWTPLHSASENGQKDMVIMLLIYGASVNSNSNNGSTPLHSASKSDSADVAMELVGRGGDVNASSNDGWTVLHLASYHGHKNMVNYLLSVGAQVASKNNEGQTALDVARMQGRTEIVHTLERAISEHETHSAYYCTKFRKAGTRPQHADVQKENVLENPSNKLESWHDILTNYKKQRATWFSAGDYTSRAALDHAIKKARHTKISLSSSTSTEALRRAVEAEKREKAMLTMKDGLPSEGDLQKAIDWMQLELTRDVEDLMKRLSIVEEMEFWKSRLRNEEEARQILESQERNSDTSGANNKEIESGRQAIVRALLAASAPQVRSVPASYILKLTNNWETKKIGSGGFGSVYEGVDSTAGTIVAVKRINSDLMEDRERKNFETEIKLLSQLGHPNVIRILGYCSDESMLCMVLEYAAGGSVHSILSSEETRQVFIPSYRLYVAEALVATLQYLHSQKIYHRDIKPENLCMWEDWETNPKMVLIDFGVADKIAESNALKTQTSHPGTVMYMADEYLNYPYRFTDKSEVFSVGVVLQVLLTGDSSFSKFNHRNCTKDQLLEHLDRSAGEWPNGSSNKLAALAVHCVRHKAAERPTIAELLLESKRIRYQVDCNVSPSRQKVVTAYLSRSRPSRLESPKTDMCCVCCGVLTKEGLLCSNGHLICNVGLCLEELIREKLGLEKLRCPGNNCRKYFVPQDIYGKVSPALYAEMVVAIEKKNEYNEANIALQNSLLEMKREIIEEIKESRQGIVAHIAAVRRHDSESWNLDELQEGIQQVVDATAKLGREEAKLMKRIDKLNEQHQRGLSDDFTMKLDELRTQMEKLSLQHASGVSMMASGRLQCPRLCILWPVRSQRGVVKRFAIAKEYRLFFLCAHDKSLVRTSIVIKETKKWIKTAKPIVKYALLSIRMMSAFYGVPIPNLPEYITGSNACEKLQSVIEQMTGILEPEDIRDLEEWVEERHDGTELMEFLDRKERQIPPEAYGALVAEAYKPKNLGWMKEMEIANKGDVFAWVKKTNVEAWKCT